MFYLVKCLAIVTLCTLMSRVRPVPVELEKTPYQFGFNLGTQHREESKDASGIVTGEYGFETADGYYHSFQYATDEEGRFRIISRKRIKISPPKETQKPDDGSQAGDGQDGSAQDDPRNSGRNEPTTTTTTTTERVKIYQFNYTAPEHGHQEMGFSDTSKMGEYYWDGPDGIRRIITYNADDALGYVPTVREVKITPGQQ